MESSLYFDVVNGPYYSQCRLLVKDEDLILPFETRVQVLASPHNTLIQKQRVKSAFCS